MDLCGTPAAKVIMRDSNPGTVTMRPGGVGRNIAHNLSLLGFEVSMISAVGGDAFGRVLLEQCREVGMNTDMVRAVREQHSSSYMYMTDETGDMLVAVNDMDIVKTVTPAYLMPHMWRINRADAVVVDANLPEESIAYLAKHCTVPLFADPVSTVKAPRLLPLLPKLAGFKPNLMEAQTLTGETDALAAGRALQAMGVKRVLVSQGSAGVLAIEGDEVIQLPIVATNIVNTNGAGDAATAAMIYGCVHGLGLAETAYAAMKAGALTAATAETNNPALCPAAIQ